MVLGSSDECMDDPQMMSDLFRAHFTRAGSGCQRYNGGTLNSGSSMFLFPCTGSEVESAIRMIAAKSSCDRDGIPFSVVKKVSKVY